MLTFLVDHRGDTGGDWVDDGCSLNNSGEGSVRCTCDHMTHFALLLQVKEDAPKVVGNSVECLIPARFYPLYCRVCIISVSLKTTRKPNERHEQTWTKASCWSWWLWLVIHKVLKRGFVCFFSAWSPWACVGGLDLWRSWSVIHWQRFLPHHDFCLPVSHMLQERRNDVLTRNLYF